MSPFPCVCFLSEVLVRAFCWCQDCSDTSIALVVALLWYRYKQGSGMENGGLGIGTGCGIVRELGAPE